MRLSKIYQDICTTMIDPNILILIVGKSGSGKSTFQNFLVCKYGLKDVQSYTTRPKRFDNEIGHIFVTKEEFDALENKVAYTEFNGYEYCATKEQLDKSNIYIIDPKGIESLKQNYDEKFLFIVYLDTDENICRKRMKMRGDDKEKVEERIKHDREAFRNVTFDYVLDAGDITSKTLESFINTYNNVRFNARLCLLEDELEELECLKKLP